MKYQVQLAFLSWFRNRIRWIIRIQQELEVQEHNRKIHPDGVGERNYSRGLFQIIPSTFKEYK